LIQFAAQAKTSAGDELIQDRLHTRDQVALFGFLQHVEQADDAEFEVGRELARFAFVDEQDVGVGLQRQPDRFCFAPIDLTQGFGATGVFALVARLGWTLPVTLVFTWVTMRAGGSVLPALALHTGINTIPDFAMRDPGRYERAMVLYALLMLALAIAIAHLDPRLWRPVAAASSPSASSSGR
jgi:hypothetical protein